MVGPVGPRVLVWCQRTIFPCTTLKIAVACWPGPSHWLWRRSPSKKVAVAVWPCEWIETMRPEQGRALFQATASWRVCSVRTWPSWTTSAPFAKRLPAVLLSSWLSAALQARTTLSADGEPPPQPASSRIAPSSRSTRLVPEANPDPTLYSSPMLFDLSGDQREIQALAREFAESEIAPNAGEWDRQHGFPRELLAKLADLGLLGVCVPEEYGGAGADFLSYILVLEEISRADAGVGVTVAVHTSAVTLPILGFGTDEQRSRFVPPLARGEAIGAFALTEPEAGSDAGSLRTAATANGDGWTISGSKQWITNGNFGGTVLLFARTDPDTPGPKGVSAVILDGDQVRVTREEEKLGLNSSSTVDLLIEDSEVGRDRLLHEEGKGFTVAMATLDGGRIGIAAQALGIAQAAYDTAREYALERRQFGKRIGDFQAIQWKLADMATEIDAARLLVYRAAWLKQEGSPHTEEGAKAKLFASEMARRQTGEAIQILGGYGYTKEFPVERYYRDAKVTEIYEGTSEIQRLVIARSILGLAQRAVAVRRDTATT